MKVFKPTELQRDKLRRALKDSSDVLDYLKTKTLTGKALSDMQNLEMAVQVLEYLAI